MFKALVIALVNRHFSQEPRIALVEHLWRLAHADRDLGWQEDHLARKLSDLLYVPHVQCMLARQRAREGGRGPDQTSRGCEQAEPREQYQL